MDKGFNDDELADIMNEIESLEKEFTEDGKDIEIEHKLVEQPESEVRPVEDDNVHRMKKEKVESPKTENSMNFSVKGDMRLNLNFDIAGKCVELHIDEDGFEIEVEGGMKFTIPTHEHGLKKTA